VSHRTDVVAALLRDLGARLERGSRTEAGRDGRRLATGIPDLDRLLGGGVPSGRLTEITGPASSGRTSVALALLARATRAGEVAAWIDGAHALDAASAETAGAVLDRVLWARPPDPHAALRCGECLIGAGGFALVVLDVAHAAGASRRLPDACWQRLARRARGCATALVVVSDARSTGSQADLVLELRPPRAHFSGTPALLDALSIQAHVARHRSGPAQRAASLRLTSPRAAP
jgi:RecA/RadA recombinase